MNPIIQSNDIILMEAAVIERLRRCENSPLHECLLNAPLIYDSAGAEALEGIYGEYIHVAATAGLPIMLCSPTWRANRECVMEEQVSPRLNRDAVNFMKNLRRKHSPGGAEIFIGGLVGCRHDCYQPLSALSMKRAEAFHGWQIEDLAAAGPDFLMAATLPSVEEAVGIAKAMAPTGIPYIVSFVISRDGRILDGCDLRSAMERIDEESGSPPMGYMINCAYPTFLCPDSQPQEVFERLIGYQANASSLDHHLLDGAVSLQMEDVSEWGEEMRKLHEKYGIRILGGCCGTNAEHLRYIAGNRRMVPEPSRAG